MTEFETNYLAHHGIKGQKWGIRRTPEELGHGPKNPKQSKQGFVKKAIEQHKRSKAQSEADSRETLKQYLRKHPKKMPIYGKTLTQEEANEVIKQIEFDRKLKAIRNDEVQAGWERLKNTANNVNTLYQLANNSKNLYNTAAEINNAMIDAGVIKNGKKWVRVGGKNDNNNNN